MNPATQKLPDMTGQTLSEAIAILESYGFQFQTSKKVAIKALNTKMVVFG